MEEEKRLLDDELFTKINNVLRTKMLPFDKAKKLLKDLFTDINVENKYIDTLLFSNLPSDEKKELLKEFNQTIIFIHYSRISITDQIHRMSNIYKASKNLKDDESPEEPTFFIDSNIKKTRRFKR